MSPPARLIFTLHCLLLSGSFFLLACTQSNQNRNIPASYEVRGMADASLRPALEELAQAYQRETSFHLQLRFLSLQELIPNLPGDSVDVYFFANNSFPDSPVDSTAGLDSTAGPDSTTGRILAYAVPCIIVPQFNSAMVSDLTDLLKPEIRLGMVDPAYDVLGLFSLEILKKNNVYQALESRLTLYGPSALDLAESVAKKEIDAAIGWTVFPNWTQGSTDVILLNPTQIPRVAALYILKAQKPIDSANADRLLTYLNSERCLEVFRKWGYLTSKTDLEMYAPLAELGGPPEP